MIRCNECESGKFFTVRTTCMNCNGGSNFVRCEQGKQVVRENVTDSRVIDKHNLIHGGFVKDLEDVKGIVEVNAFFI